MKWKYCLVEKENIVSLHFMFINEDGKQLVSEQPVTAEAYTKEDLVKYLFDMIRTLGSRDLEVMCESELE